jgi:hypothetical protein
MRLIREQSGIYRGEDDGRCYLFLRWRAPDQPERYQMVDFATRAEAACFLTGARSACQVCKKLIRFDTVTPGEYHLAVNKTKPH